MTELSASLLARIAERAHDPRRRTDDASLALDAKPLDLQANVDQLVAMGHPDAGQLQGMMAGLANMVGRVGGHHILDGIVLTGADGSYTLGTPPKPKPLASPPREEVLESAEARLGGPIPVELRQLYAIGNGGFGPGNGLFALADMVERYSDLTAETHGLAGLEWPADLLPLFDCNPQWLCLDRNSGEVICWDPEAIGDEGSVDEWRGSFVPQADSLGGLMEWWLDEPTRAEIMEQARQQPVTVPQEMIDFYAAMTPEQRAEHGFEGDDWEDQLRQQVANWGNTPTTF